MCFPLCLSRKILTRFLSFPPLVVLPFANLSPFPLQLTASDKQFYTSNTDLDNLVSFTCNYRGQSQALQLSTSFFAAL